MDEIIHELPNFTSYEEHCLILGQNNEKTEKTEKTDLHQREHDSKLVDFSENGESNKKY